MTEADISPIGHNRTTAPQLHGVLVVNKPSGPTSGRCLAAIKRLGQKKIGHAGTLDPSAGGVLLVLLGQATKLSSHLLAGGGKVYSGTVRLGQTTDTWDSQGRIIAEAPWEKVSPEAVRREIALWREMRVQLVPPYSAAKHEGQPLYRLARKGRDVPQKVKRMEIAQADTLDVSLPFVRFRVACRSGTYIRSLAHSLGMRLGCGAVLTELTREYSSPFGLDAACSPDALLAEPERLFERVLPVTRAFPHWPVIAVSEEEEIRVRTGRGLLPDSRTDFAPRALGEHAFLLAPDKTPLALAESREQDGCLVWTVLRGLWN